MSTNTNILETNGIWQVEQQSHKENGFNAIAPASDVFVIEYPYITIRLLSISQFRNQPQDDIYKLRIKWEEDKLSYLLPLSGTWQPLATFVKGIFFAVEGGVKWIYHKTGGENLAEKDKGLLNPNRLPWNYNDFGIEINQ